MSEFNVMKNCVHCNLKLTFTSGGRKILFITRNVGKS